MDENMGKKWQKNGQKKWQKPSIAGFWPLVA
jgi:hypothetical protein